MTRFLAALLVTLALTGSVALCQFGLTRQVEVALTNDAHDPVESADDRATPEYRLVLTPTFSIADDPFALDVGGDEPQVRIRVRSGGRDLVRWTENVRRGEPIVVEDVSLPGSEADLFVEAVPEAADAMAPLAMRLQIFRGDVVYGDATMWTPGGGAPLSAQLRLALQPIRDRLDRGLGEGAR